jgi:hypothetical protein
LRIGERGKRYRELKCILLLKRKLPCSDFFYGIGSIGIFFDKDYFEKQLHSASA